ncbi:MAG: AI-2E family transporter [Ruminococcus sp.]|nr:AI-2E family transporter [Ruminococcus sp.]HOO06525.1 AI-2E family transporter [Ruminococcus sp.]HOR22388.1 AI-2E family transporter [Ruminococcus sp.]
MKHIKELIHKRWFATALGGCITVAFYLIVSNIVDIWQGFTQILGYFSTVIGGCALAYMMNPLAKLYQRSIFRRIRKETLKWTLSIILAVTTVILFLVLIMSILIPQLIDSVSMFISNLDSYAKSLQSLIRGYLPEDHESPSFQNFVLSSENIINTIVDYIMENSSKIINISTNAGKSVVNWVIAFILSIYLLGAKNKLKAGVKRLLKALLSPKHYKSASTFLSHCNGILNRYVIFDLIDGLIVGTVNAIFMAILGMQYSGLVSVVVGVTNLVPTFGPLVGAIIGGFILLMVKPVHALFFVIFTIILQTIDGYVIKPKLFGGTLGVSGLWILIVIIAGGRIYGIVGILLAIPIAAILDYIYREMLLPALERKNTSATENNENTTGYALTEGAAGNDPEEKQT